MKKKIFFFCNKRARNIKKIFIKLIYRVCDSGNATRLWIRRHQFITTEFWTIDSLGDVILHVVKLLTNYCIYIPMAVVCTMRRPHSSSVYPHFSSL